MDFFYWGGPVYCSTAQKIEWKRPTKLYCNPLEGGSNNSFFHSLGGDPLGALLGKAGLDPAAVGSIGFGGFSAFHGFLDPLLQRPEAVERIDYVHLADACFLGAGATSPKPGFVQFAKKAVAGKARMIATTNGPWGKDISYSGPAGSKYEGTRFNLTSGAKCFELVWQAAAGSLGGDPEVPAGVPAPSRAYRSGQLYWFHYEQTLKDPHGDHANVLARPYIQQYGVPWMAGERGVPAWPLAMVAGALGGYAAARYFGLRERLGL